VALRETGRYEEPIAVCKKALHRNCDQLIAHISLAATYIHAGGEGEARAAAVEVVKIQPTFSLERFEKAVPYKNQADTDRFI
jgi:hypothetical protein